VHRLVAVMYPVTHQATWSFFSIGITLVELMWRRLLLCGHEVDVLESFLFGRRPSSISPSTPPSRTLEASMARTLEHRVTMGIACLGRKGWELGMMGEGGVRPWEVDHGPRL
jgi:hypothetical protein